MQATRKRLVKLFEFLKAYTDLSYPPVRDINQQPRTLWLKDLPIHTSVEVLRDAGKVEDEVEDNDTVLRLTRPTITTCPSPPAALSEWLKPGWREFAGKVEVEATRNVVDRGGKTRIERFEEDPRHLSLLSSWQQQREQWVANERPARQSLALFQTIYEWYGIQERQGEKTEMLIGDGLLCCSDTNGDFRHPVLLQKLELEFYPEKKQPQFIFRKRELPPELYMEFLRVLPEVNNQQLARCADELKKTEFAPLGENDTDGFLLRLVQGLFPSRGRMSKSAERPDDLEIGQAGPTIKRDPVIFMRHRRTGPSSIFDAVLNDINSPSRIDFSPALLRILGFTESVTVQAEAGIGNSASAMKMRTFCLASQLIENNWKSRNVSLIITAYLSKGHPGPGKTHTIANLLGHLLAQGKRVLVTAHTPKALRVLRQKVVEALQPLCVSVLRNDKQSQEELQGSVRKIHIRLGENDRLLEREAGRLREERKRIIKTLCETRQQFIDARQGEIRDVVFAGKSLRPIDAAKRIREGIGKDDWIPSPVSLGDANPISNAEVAVLYQTNGLISLADERELNDFRPELGTLPTPNRFQSVVDEMNSLATYDLRFREEFWDSSFEPDDLAEFERMLESAGKTIEFLRESVLWQLEAVQAGRDGEHARREWESLAEMIEATWRDVHECHSLVMEDGPSISDTRAPHELLPLIEEIIQHAGAGNSFGFATKLTKRRWFDFIEKAQIGGRAPNLKDVNHLRAIYSLLRIRILREQLLGRWERQMATQGGPTCSELGDKPEQVCKQFVGQIRSCLEWHTSIWQPLELEFQRLGFRWVCIS